MGYNVLLDWQIVGGLAAFLILVVIMTHTTLKAIKHGFIR